MIVLVCGGDPIRISLWSCVIVDTVNSACDLQKLRGLDDLAVCRVHRVIDPVQLILTPVP